MSQPYGTFNGEFTLQPNAMPGDYNFTVGSNGKDLYGGNLYFQVADYRKPEINLSVEFSPETGEKRPAGDWNRQSRLFLWRAGGRLALYLDFVHQPVLFLHP